MRKLFEMSIWLNHGREVNCSKWYNTVNTPNKTKALSSDNIGFDSKIPFKVQLSGICKGNPRIKRFPCGMREQPTDQK